MVINIIIICICRSSRRMVVTCTYFARIITWLLVSWQSLKAIYKTLSPVESWDSQNFFFVNFNHFLWRLKKLSTQFDCWESREVFVAEIKRIWWAIQQPHIRCLCKFSYATGGGLQTLWWWQVQILLKKLEWSLVLWQSLTVSPFWSWDSRTGVFESCNWFIRGLEELFTKFYI